MNVKIKLLHPNAVLPTKGSAQAAGYDITVPEDTEIMPGRNKVPTGIAFSFADGYGADFDPRSGNSLKGIEGYRTHIDGTHDTEKRRFNADVIHGLGDPDYTGEYCFIVRNDDGPFMIPAGTKLAQLRIHKREEIEWEQVDSLEETERGEGGFGHTDE